MKKCANGIIVELTEEEIAELKRLEAKPSEQTLEERLAALEALVAERGIV